MFSFSVYGRVRFEFARLSVDTRITNMLISTSVYLLFVVPLCSALLFFFFYFLPHITVAGTVKCSKDHFLKGKMNVSSVILASIQRLRLACFTVAEVATRCTPPLSMTHVQSAAATPTVT